MLKVHAASLAGFSMLRHGTLTHLRPLSIGAIAVKEIPLHREGGGWARIKA
jgi:hypothetical protein